MDQKEASKTVNVFIYKLSFFGNIVDPDKNLHELEVGQLETTELKYNNENYIITLHGIQYERKVYQPNEINAELQFALKNPADNNGKFLSQSELSDLLLQRAVTLSMRGKDDKEDTVVGQHFYVHEICPQVVRTASETYLFVKLKIFSIDKLMTLNKYSKAYVAKKLGADILTNESKLFGYKNALVPVYTKNMQHLIYLSAGDSSKKEFIQPYLVQYNESFYDFMARTANRCGELLFFDEGRLVLGMPENKKAVKIEHYASVTYQNTTKAPLSINMFARDSVKGTSEPEFNDYPIASASTGYPEGTFGNDFNYNSALAHDDYIFPMIKDKFSSFGRVIGGVNVKAVLSKLALNVFSNVVGNTEAGKDGVKSIGIKLLSTYAKESIVGGFSTKSITDNGNKTWIENHITETEHCNGNRYIQFAPVDEGGWVKLAYYSQIRSLQEAQQQKIVCIDMGETMMPVSLGDIVTIDKMSGKYVVIQISQTASNKGTSLSYQKYEDEAAGKTIDNQQSQRIFAIPVADDNTIVPPVINMPVVRESGPQTAYIVDNNDPKCQGRVRIAFPWQSINDKTRRLQLDEAASNHKNAEENLNIAKENKKKLESLVNQLNKESKLLKDLADELGKMPDNAAKIRRIEEVKQENKKAIETLAKDELKKEEVAARKQFAEVINNYDGKSSPTDFVKAAVKTKTETEIPTTKKNLDEANKIADKAEKQEKAAAKEVESLTKMWNEELEEVASPWIRVATPMATSQGGVYFRPLKGDEVMVNFDSNNVERPYVSGSLYSKEHTDPGGVMTIKSPSGQKISFDVAQDDSGALKKLLPFLMALQGYCSSFLPDLMTSKDDARKLAGGISLSDEFGMFSIKMSSTDRSVSIASPFGNVSVNAFTGISISAPNGDIKIEGKNVTITAGNNLKLQSGTNVKHPGNPTPGGKKVHEKGRFGKIGSGIYDFGKEIADGAITGAEEYVQSNYIKGLAPVDMSLLRSLADVFLRPIEGTLQLKSENYLKLEAGRGQTEVSMDRYSDEWKKWKKFEADVDKQKFYAKTTAYVELAVKKVGEFCDEYVELKRDAIKKQKEYDKKIKDIWDSAEDPGFKKAAFILGDGEFKKYDSVNKKNGTMNYDVIKNENIKNHGNFIIISTKKILKSLSETKNYVIASTEAFGESVSKLQQKTRTFKTCFCKADEFKDVVESINKSALKIVGQDEDTKWIDTQFELAMAAVIDEAIQKWEDRFGKPTGGEMKAEFLAEKAEYDKRDIFTNAKYIRRKLVGTFLLNIYNHAFNMIPGVQGAAAVKGKYIELNFDNVAGLQKLIDEDHWGDVAVLGPKRTFWKRYKGKLLLEHLDNITGIKKAWSPVYNKDLPYNGWDRKVWNGESGRIIFSDAQNATFAFEGENIVTWKHSALNNIGMLRKVLGGV